MPLSSSSEFPGKNGGCATEGKVTLPDFCMCAGLSASFIFRRARDVVYHDCEIGQQRHSRDKPWSCRFAAAEVGVQNVNLPLGDWYDRCEGSVTAMSSISPSSSFKLSSKVYNAAQKHGVRKGSTIVVFRGTRSHPADGA
jgi:hypothetical protein